MPLGGGRGLTGVITWRTPTRPLLRFLPWTIRPSSFRVTCDSGPSPLLGERSSGSH